MNKIPGHIIGIDRKTEEETQDKDVLIEITDTAKDGEVEICMEDRNETFYVRFRLQDLLREVMNIAHPDKTS